MARYRLRADNHARHRARVCAPRHSDHEHARIRRFVLYRVRRITSVDEPDRPRGRTGARHALLGQVQQHVQSAVRCRLHDPVARMHANATERATLLYTRRLLVLLALGLLHAAVFWTDYVLLDSYVQRHLSLITLRPAATLLE